MSKPTLCIYGIKDRNDYTNPGYTHDHNVCLMEEGKVLKYLQLERYTRRKYDNRLDLFLEELIDEKLLEIPNEFDLVSINSFVGDSFISKSGRIRFETSKESLLTPDLRQAYCWVETKKWMGKEVAAYNCSHELAHIGSCLPFYGDFKENSLLIHFDGGASLSNFSAFHFLNGKINSIEYHWELKHLSKLFNDNALSFAMMNAKPGEHCSVPGKLMGYAALGKYNPEIERWLRRNKFFSNYWNQTGEILNAAGRDFSVKLKNFDAHNTFLQDVAATIQFIFQSEFLKKLTELQEKIGAIYLYYAGGCALNIVTNTKLVEGGLFKDVFIPPCCNDSGLSLGGAALLERQKHGFIEKHSPYLNSVGLSKSSAGDVNQNSIKETAELILAGGIIGICNNTAEVGPRALGNRSIIALANSKSIARKVSMECKKREWFRPLAPVMLKEVAEKVITQPMHPLAKYMLLDFTIKEDYQQDLTGIIHGNGTARIQTLESHSDNPFLYQLLSYLYAHHGILALINTSFNGGGEPIVHTPYDATQSAKKMNLDALVINGQIKILNYELAKLQTV